MTFGERLRELRIKQGLSIYDLAKQIGCSHMAISRWENEVSNPNIYNAWDLADFFGVTVDYLIGRKGE